MNLGSVYSKYSRFHGIEAAEKLSNLQIFMFCVPRLFLHTTEGIYLSASEIFR